MVTVLAFAFVTWRAVARVRQCGFTAALVGAPPEGYAPRAITVEFRTWGSTTRAALLCGLGLALALVAWRAAPWFEADRALFRAQVFLQAGDAERAAALCRSVLDSRPADGVAHDVLGQCYYAQGRWREAIRELRRAIELGGADVQTFASLARSYRQLGQLEEAERTYRTVVAAYPGHRLARKERGEFLRELGREPNQ